MAFSSHRQNLVIFRFETERKFIVTVKNPAPSRILSQFSTLVIPSIDCYILEYTTALNFFVVIVPIIGAVLAITFLCKEADM